MRPTTKIDFRPSRFRQIAFAMDLVELLFPGNRNQQHAAARILIELRRQGGLVESLSHLEDECDVSRRTLQRSRAKLRRLGVIERVGSPLRTGACGWRLSGKMATSLRALVRQR